MKSNNLFLVKIKTAIQSSDPLRRLWGPVLAALLYSLPPSLRKTMFKADKHYCPICQSQVSRFLMLNRTFNLWCPVCRSLQRQRLGWIFLNSNYVQITHSPKRMLHIAPEPAFLPLLNQIEGLDYITADLHNPNVMVQMDICDIQYPENSFDIIYCSHVLEHVQEESKALHEFLRVLKPGGCAIIMVPINAPATFDDPSITSSFERWQKFGQIDHVRRYGPDVVQRLEKAGFKVTSVKSEDLASPTEVQRQGLKPGETVFFCQK